MKREPRLAVPSKPAHASARKPKRKSPRQGTQVIPEPFACSAIVHGERVYVAQDMRHDEAEAYADHIGAQAVEGIWVSKAIYAQAEADADRPGASYQAILYRLLAELRKGSFTLETPTKE